VTAAPAISAAATRCRISDHNRSRNASAGVPRAGSRVRCSVTSTGTAARANTNAVTIRSAVPRVCEISPISSHQRGRTNRKYRTPPTSHTVRCSAVAVKRPIPLLML
jgi:hypothetical protein